MLRPLHFRQHHIRVSSFSCCCFVFLSGLPFISYRKFMPSSKLRGEGFKTEGDGMHGPNIEQVAENNGADPRLFFEQTNPRRAQVAAGSSVITAMQISQGRIIIASDNNSITVYDLAAGHVLHSLDGHEGGVWAIAVSGNTLTSGSSDRTLRIWDFVAGRAMHVFRGHTGTVRCVVTVEPELTEVEGEDGVVVREMWPKRPLIVTGSRDHTLRVWRLPQEGSDEYCYGSSDSIVAEPSTVEGMAADNPYHMYVLKGHGNSVRAIAAQGTLAVSGSYDTTVRVWDLTRGACQWVLEGHTQKVYSVALDTRRSLAYSGSMDCNVRVWDLEVGTCRHVLTGHTSLVALLNLSPSYLVSGSADATLRVWNPDSGKLLHLLDHRTGAVTCFQHDEYKVISGADGALKLWDIRKGSYVRSVLSEITSVWQVAFEGRWCVAAVNREQDVTLEIWDFGREEEKLGLTNDT